LRRNADSLSHDRDKMAETAETRKRGPVALEVPYPSKVVLPVRRPTIIRRQRLVEALSRALEQRITLVTAPAGYGKTTLLLDFAQASGAEVCWYALDERDRDLSTFLRYVVASGQTRVPEFGGQLADALRKGEEVEAERAVDLLVEAMHAHGRPLTFILDDFHFLDDASEELVQVIQGWLYRLPPDSHVILSGRTQAQLAILPLMSVRQEVDTITSSDFSFSCEEVVQLFRDVLGKEISLDDAQHLADVTEGWAAALVLLADRVQMSKTSISLEQLRGSDTLFQYIKLEQFDPLPADVKEFMIGSAVPRWLDEQFLNELLELTDSEQRLNYLRRLNLFVRNDDGGRRRYHRLFRAFLVSHLRSREPERFRELNLEAAAQMEKAQEWEEAVYHYIQASGWERIVQVTDRVGWRMFEEGRWDTLADWLEAVPVEELASQPKLVLWKARVLHYLNQIDRALALLEQAIASLEAKGEWITLAEALVTQGMCLRVKGSLHESKQSLGRARELLLEHDGPTSALTEARLELGRTYSLAGEFEPALAEMRNVLDIYEAKGDIYNVGYVSDQLAVIVAHLGRIADATVHFERARQCWTRLGNDERLLMTLNNLGVLYYWIGDFVQAEDILKQGLAKAPLAPNSRAGLYLRVSLADLRRDSADYTAALDMYREAMDMARMADEAVIRVFIADSIANTYRLIGDLTNCETWAQRATAEAEERAGTLESGVCATTLGLIARDTGDFKEASETLERAVAQLRETDAKRELGLALFHLAGVHFSLKRKKLALEALDEVAALVEELGYDHFIYIEAARNPLLVQYAAANKLAGGYFGRLLKTMKGARQSAAPARAEAAPESGTEAAIQAFGFGNLRVEVAGREITDLEWRSEKSKEMYFFFLCNRRPLRKEEIVAALWPDLPDEKTTSAFHSNMYRLRKAIYQECIAKDSGRYILDPQGLVAFDVERFQRLLAEADRVKGTPEALKLMEDALELYKGPFAMDFYSEWAETLRWQLSEQNMSLLTTLATAYSEAKEYKRSADVCQRILELDEYNEAAWYRLMSNYILSGQLEAAKFCYKRYVQVLSADDLGEDVPDFEEVQREIAAGR
jgi:ATP/maltotriose-dependent transcriptional regulator MalT/two-component SAPR family response regulator